MPMTWPRRSFLVSVTGAAELEAELELLEAEELAEVMLDGVAVVLYVDDCDILDDVLEIEELEREEPERELPLAESVEEVT